MLVVTGYCSLWGLESPEFRSLTSSFLRCSRYTLRPPSILAASLSIALLNWSSKTSLAASPLTASEESMTILFLPRRSFVLPLRMTAPSRPVSFYDELSAGCRHPPPSLLLLIESFVAGLYSISMLVSFSLTIRPCKKQIF